jgi:hypothetical protein
MFPEVEDTWMETTLPSRHKFRLHCTAETPWQKTVLEDVFLKMILLEVASIFNSMGLT